MINKESNNKKDKPDKADENASVNVSAHIVIKDCESGKTIVNKRG